MLEPREKNHSMVYAFHYRHNLEARRHDKYQIEKIAGFHGLAVFTIKMYQCTPKV